MLSRFSVLFLLLPIVACGASEPGSPDRLNQPDGGSDKQPAPDTTGIYVKDLPVNTYWDSIPVSGKGPKNGIVEIQGPKGSISTNLSADGSFCVEVPLNQDTSNTISIVAHNKAGKDSKKVTLSIKQEGTPPKPGEEVVPKNVALGAHITTSFDNEGGPILEDDDYRFIVDGKLNTKLLFQDSLLQSDYLLTKLRDSAKVVRVRVVQSIDCYTNSYTLFTTSSSSNSLEVPENGKRTGITPWEIQSGLPEFPEADDCSTDKYFCQDFTIKADKVSAIGFRKHTFSDQCTDWSLRGIQYIHEIQAWTDRTIAPPIVTAPSCSSGGF